MNRHISFVCAALLAGAGIAHAQLPSIPGGPQSIELQAVATGLTSPIDLVSAEDGTGRLFIVEQGGTVRVLKNGALNATPFLNISTQIKAGGERGLLGLAFHPQFSHIGTPGFRKLYTYQTENPSGPADFTVPASGFDNQCVVTEWQVSGANGDVVDPASRRDVIRIDHPQGNHNGGKIAFRPSDGYLYIAIGDGGSGGDVGDGHTPNLGNAQDVQNLLGKILRIDPLSPTLTQGSANPVSGNGKYRNPADNPFVGAPGREEIFAFGFRNPYRFSFDQAEDLLIVGDVGQGAIEEVNVVERGGNYGWNRKEGSFLYNSNGSVSPDPNPNPAFINPVLEYDHDDGISVIAGFVYRGTAMPPLARKYIFGDFLRRNTPSGRLFYGDLSARTIHEFRLGVNPRSLGLQIKGFGTDGQSGIYVLADAGGSGGGQALKIVPIPAAPALVNLSTRLRVETGENVGIAGFILTGSTAKTVVIRGLGPSLSVNGQPVAGRMSNPRVTVFDGSGVAIGGNDDWQNPTPRREVTDNGLAPSDPRESAVVMTLHPGAYTATIEGVNGESGVGLIELYDIEQGAPANATNISTRGRVQTGDNVLIGGFIIGGGETQRVMVRAIGPSLTARGVAGALQNPTLELVNSSGTAIGSNDNWRSDQATEISNSALAPESDAEAAIIRSLPPGNYTGVVRGVGGATGVGLVEVYRLNP